MIIAIGGLYNNSDLAIWPTAPNTTGNPHELEVVSGFSATSTVWSLAASLIRPNMSQTAAETGKTVDGILLTAYVDDLNCISVKWNSHTNSIDVYCRRDDVIRCEFPDPTLSLPVGQWFRTWPLSLILSDDGTKLEATALSPRFGLVSASAASGSLGASPIQVRLSNFCQTKVYNLEVCGVAYKDEFMNQAARETSLTALDFLVPP